MNCMKTILTLFFVVTSFTTSAVTICVDDSQSFESALITAANNNQADHIQIARGTTLVTINGFIYDGESEPFDLTISGGWYEGLEKGAIFCNAQSKKYPESVINGNGLFRGLLIKSHPSSNIELSYLSFINGAAVAGSGGGLFVKNGNVLIENNVFISNTAPLGGAALFVANGSKYVIRNNLFAYNPSTVFAGAVSINSLDQTTGVYFTNNTVIFNSTASTSSTSCAGLNLTNNGSAKAYIGNNILWGNDFNDIVMGGTGYKYLINNDIGGLAGQIGDVETGNITQDPEFIDLTTNNFMPKAPSSLVNSGRHPLNPQEHPTFDNLWAMGEFDLNGEPRVQGNRVDMGAYETSDVIFKNGFAANNEL